MLAAARRKPARQGAGKRRAENASESAQSGKEWDCGRLSADRLGAHLLEDYIRQAKTVEEFEKLIGGSVRPATDALRENEYQRCRNCVLAGEGVGKDLIQKYVPVQR